MANLYAHSANFEEVKLDSDALMFHALNFDSGQRYPLAKLCYQYWMMTKHLNA